MRDWWFEAIFISLALCAAATLLGDAVRDGLIGAACVQRVGNKECRP